jgi:Ubiquitin family.
MKVLVDQVGKIEIESNETVECFKAKADTEHGFLGPMQRLYKDQTLLQDGYALSDYDVSSGDILIMKLETLKGVKVALVGISPSPAA